MYKHKAVGCQDVLKMDNRRWSNVTIALALAVFIVACIFVFVLNGRYDAIEPPKNDQSNIGQRALTDSSAKDPSLKVNDLANISAAIQTKVAEATTDIDFKLIVLSPRDQKAVVLNAQGQTQLVTVGDRIGEERYEVLQVTSEKLVLKHAKTGATLWLHEGEGKEKGRIQQFSSQIQSDEIPPSASNGQSAGDVNK